MPVLHALTPGRTDGSHPFGDTNSFAYHRIEILSVTPVNSMEHTPEDDSDGVN
jgi:hypothetical protein